MLKERDGASGRNRVSISYQELGAVQPSWAPHGILRHPDPAVSNQNGPMGDGNLHTGPNIGSRSAHAC